MVEEESEKEDEDDDAVYTPLTPAGGRGFSAPSLRKRTKERERRSTIQGGVSKIFFLKKPGMFYTKGKLSF